MKFSRTRYGFVITFGKKEKVIFRFVNYFKLIRELYAQSCFRFDRERLAFHGIRIAMEAYEVWTGDYKIEKVKVGYLKVNAGNKTLIKDSDYVKYLTTGDEKVLADYLAARTRLNASKDCSAAAHAAMFNTLKSEYDPAISCIIINEEDEIIDGRHRASSICAAHGSDHEATVVRVYSVPKFKRYNKLAV